MKYRMLILAFVLAACAKTPPPAASPTGPASTPDERTRIGNGGGDDALRDNAWFLGSEPIRVCIEGTDLEKAAAEEAFAIWKQYLSEKRLADAAYYPERSSLPADKPILAEHRIVDCSASPELRIVIGKTEDARLNWERLNEFPGKSAFVVRRSYDAATGRGRGDMWISSSRFADKSEGSQRVWITGHAVHELGHVLGCPHVPDTLMAEDTAKTLEGILKSTRAKDLQDAEGRAKAVWPDQAKELLTCRDCTVQVKVGWTHTQYDVFVALFGDDALNEVSPAYYIDLVMPEGRPAQLTFASDYASEWKRVISVSEQKLEQATQGDIPLFKATWKTGDALSGVASYQTTLRYSGKVLGNYEGKEIPIPVEILRNGKDGALLLVLPDRESFWLKGTRTGPLRAPEETK